MSACKICLNESENRVHTVREMAFGLGDSFRYLECARCGCLQLLEIPTNMERYYPGGYYSLQPQGRLKTFIRHRWTSHAYGRKNLAGGLISVLYGPRRTMLAFARVNPDKKARILDLGCGAGTFLLDLAWLGFENLAGADPFLSHDLKYREGVTVYKRQLVDMAGPFDLIMLHHSFEHMDQPADVMRQLAARLEPGGQLILAIPAAASFGWRHFGVNWCNLDAPRHLFLHTPRSIEMLTAQAGLEIEQVVHESDGGLFWLSEQYGRGIPLHDPRSLDRPANRLRHWRYLRSFTAQAAAINARKEADMLCFHLRKPA